MRLFLLLAGILLNISAFAQGYYDLTQEEFGQNRIQLRKLDWKTIQSNNFEFNFYRGGDEIARKAAKIAETDYGKITSILGYTPFTTMKIFLYNNKKQLLQSNIGLTSPVLYNGGILNLSRSRIEIAYNENDSLFKEELIRQITTLFVYDMLYGGSLKEVLQSTMLLSVPEWFMNGIAGYIATNNSPEFMATAKECIERNANKRINTLMGKDATIIGQSIWQYIAVKYGEDNISNILNLTRIIRTEQSSITSTLGISFSRFLSEWRQYYVSGGLIQETRPEAAKPAIKVPIAAPEISKLDNLRQDEIDTENYEFDVKNVEIASKKLTDSHEDRSANFNKSRLRASSEELKISQIKAYQNLLVPQDMKLTLQNDPVRRFGLGLSKTFNDMLENHILKFDAYVAPNIRNNDIKVSYTNFEKRVDWGLSFTRRSIHLDQLSEKQFYLFWPQQILNPEKDQNRRANMHQAAAHIIYPLSPYLKLKFSPSIFFSNDIRYNELGRTVLASSFAGLKSEIIYDNTTQQLESGQLNGTRAKLAYAKNIGLSMDSKGFNLLYLDIRHYQPLIKGLLLAGRLNYGKSSGSSPKYSFLGGVENTLNRQVLLRPDNKVGQPADFRELAFYNYPGNLRGFEFAKLWGTNYLLCNFELRLALSGFWPKSATTSNVIRNLQFVLFSDIGSSWNGNKGPLSRENSLNTQVIGGNGNTFTAIVTNFKNPFLFGFGGGARTSLLGFLVKADYAFGLENKELGKGKFYISLGHDF